MKLKKNYSFLLKVQNVTIVQPIYHLQKYYKLDNIIRLMIKLYG
jgi:hypothetical protein